MVINGRRFEGFPATAVKLDGDRVPLPAKSTEVLHLTGSKAIDCWLLVITPGRYRVALNLGEDGEGTLGRIRERLLEVAAPGEILDNTETNEHPAIQGRVIPTVLAPLGTTWRITVPKEAKMLVPTGEDVSFLFVLVVAGFIELWFPDTLRRATSVPFTKILS